MVRRCRSDPPSWGADDRPGRDDRGVDFRPSRAPPSATPRSAATIRSWRRARDRTGADEPALGRRGRCCPGAKSLLTETAIRAPRAADHAGRQWIPLRAVLAGPRALSRAQRIFTFSRDKARLGLLRRLKGLTGVTKSIWLPLARSGRVDPTSLQLGAPHLPPGLKLAGLARWARPGGRSGGGLSTRRPRGPRGTGVSISMRV